MVNYLMIFGTMTHAQKAARLLDSAGITALIQRAPHKLTEKGCSYAVKVSEKQDDGSPFSFNGSGNASC